MYENGSREIIKEPSHIKAHIYKPNVMKQDGHLAGAVQLSLGVSAHRGLGSWLRYGWLALNSSQLSEISESAHL